MHTNACRRHVRYALAALIAALTLPFQARAQTAPDTEFDGNYIEGVPCPRTFPSFYIAIGKTFWGRSFFTMGPQWDPTHTSSVYTYQFTGETLDGTHRATGTHHVNSAQCIFAAWQAAFSIPAMIAYLHNAKITYIGSSGVGGDCAYQLVESAEGSTCGTNWGSSSGGSDSGDGDGSGGGDGNGGICAELLLEPGCYDVYVDGEYAGELCCA